MRISLRQILAILSSFLTFLVAASRRPRRRQYLDFSSVRCEFFVRHFSLRFTRPTLYIIFKPANNGAPLCTCTHTRYVRILAMYVVHARSYTSYSQYYLVENAAKIFPHSLFITPTPRKMELLPVWNKRFYYLL